MADKKEKKNASQPAGIKGKLPSKTSINLLIEEKNTGKNLTAILIFIIFMVGVGIFSKFMVLDKMTEIDRMEQNYHRQEDLLSSLRTANEVYDEVRSEYQRFGNSFLNEDELLMQDRLEILQVIEEELLEKDALQTVSIQDNVAQLVINSAKLANVSEIVASLEDRENVEYVLVSNASSDEVERTTYVYSLNEHFFDGTNASQTESSSDESESDNPVLTLLDAIAGLHPAEPETEPSSEETSQNVLNTGDSGAASGQTPGGLNEAQSEETMPETSASESEETSGILGAVVGDDEIQDFDRYGRPLYASYEDVGDASDPDEVVTFNGDNEAFRSDSVPDEELPEMEPSEEEELLQETIPTGEETGSTGEEITDAAQPQELETGILLTESQGSQTQPADILQTEPQTEAPVREETPQEKFLNQLQSYGVLFQSLGNLYGRTIGVMDVYTPRLEEIVIKQKIVNTAMTIYFKSAVELDAERDAKAREQAEKETEDLSEASSAERTGTSGVTASDTSETQSGKGGQ